MVKLLFQFIRFGIVGVISTLVDFGTFTALNFVGIHYLTSNVCGYLVSMIVNYILSMKFVFCRREELSRKKEFLIFCILSFIGLGISELTIWICYDKIYLAFEQITRLVSNDIAKILCKVISTGVLLVYNFISRKLILEKR